MPKRLKLTRRLIGLSAPGWRGDLAALLVGMPMVWAYAPYGIYPLAIVLLATLFWLLRELNPKQALRRGYAFGMGYFGVGISWVYVSIHVYGNEPSGLAILFTLLFAAYLSIFPAAFAWLAQMIKATTRTAPLLHMLLLLPAAWVLLEWTRGWFLTGFPWLAIGYSQLPGPLAAIAPILGVFGVSWLVALLAGTLVLLLEKRHWGFAALMIGVVLISAASRDLEWTQPAGSPISVTLVQGNIPQEVKWDEDQLQKSLDLYADLSQPHWADSRLIIWPEAAITAWYHQVAGGFLEEMRQQAMENHSELLTGIPYYDFTHSKMYNSVVSVGVDGDGQYSKVHLAPFGDYLPLEDYLRGLLNFFKLPMSSFSPGAVDQPLMLLGGYHVGVSICYEDVFGEEIIKGLPKAAFLINVSNDSWWGNSFGPQQHMQIAAMRALETGRPLLRDTNNGVTGYVDAHGYIRARLPQFVTDTLTVRLQPRSGATPYVLGGSNLPIVMLMVLLLAASAMGRLYRRK